MKVRKFVPKDLKRVFEIENMSFDQSYGINMFQQLYEMGIGFLVAEKDDYVMEARALYGEKGARDVAGLLSANAALFAGGSLSQEEKDAFFQAIMAFRREDSEGISKQITTVIVGAVLVGFSFVVGPLRTALGI